LDPTPLEALRAVLDRTVLFEERGRSLAAEVSTVLAALARHARMGPDGPLMVMLFGGANTGKSTLFNAIAGADVSPVQAVAGSTRHVVAIGGARETAALADAALWPPPYRPEALARREALLEEASPRRIYVTSSARAPASLVLLDSPDITTAYEQNARVASHVMRVVDVVVLVLTEEQHADRALVDHYPVMRDLGKKVVAVFNRVPPGRPEELPAYQKFRSVWLENRMGDVPARFFLPRVDAGRAHAELAGAPALAALVRHLEGLDRRDLLHQTRAGLVMALAQRGSDLVTQAGAEKLRLARALEELELRYRAMIAGYNERRRWSSRMLHVRSWLQSTIGAVTREPSIAEAQEAQVREKRFWQLLAGPLMGRDDRPSAVEALEVMAAALESDPSPAPLYRPLTRLARGIGSLVFGRPVAGRDTDPPALLDALELLEQARCRFVAAEVLPRLLGADWQSVLPAATAAAGNETAAAAQPAAALEEIAAEHRDMCGRLRTSILELLASDPSVRARLAKRHARLALAAGITLSVALIDMGHSALALGVGLGTPILWELLDWATSQTGINLAIQRFAGDKAEWMRRAFRRHVIGPVHQALEEREAALDPDAMRRALRHCESEARATRA
jgi:hypothetical protein